MINAPLFVRDPVSLEGYVPVFDRQASLLGYKVKKVQVGGRGTFGWNNFEDQDPEPVYDTYCSLNILGLELPVQPEFFALPRRHAVPELANKFLANRDNEKRYPEVWKFLIDNAKALSDSNRYWSAIEHLEEIAVKEEELRELQRSIDKAKIISQVKIMSVLEGRRIEGAEKQRLLVEFGWTEEL